MKRLLLVAGLCLSLAACASATPYQPLTSRGQTTGGYSEVKVDADRYRVSFSGNSLTSRETVERYLLFRAAEVTLAQGDDWFSLVDRHTDKKSSTYYWGDPWGYGYWRPTWYYGGPWGWGPGYGYGGWGPGWGGYGWGGGGGYADRIDRYQAAAEIVVGKGPKPAGDVAAFDAHEVVKNLGPVIVRPVPAS